MVPHAMSSTNSPAQEKRRRSFVGSFLVPLKTKRSDGPNEPGAKCSSKSVSSSKSGGSSTSPSTLEQLAGLPREGGRRTDGRSSQSGSVADSPPTKEKKKAKMKQRRSFDLLDTLMRDDEVHDVPSNKLQQPKGGHAKAMPKVTSTGGLGKMSRRASSMSMAAESTKARPRRNSVFALEDPPSADDYLHSGQVGAHRGQGVDVDGAWGSRGLNPLEEEVRAELHKMARKQYRDHQQQQQQQREQFNGSFNHSYQPTTHGHSKSQSPHKQQQQQSAADSFHKSESNLTSRKERRSSQSFHHEGNKGQKKQQPRRSRSKDPDGFLEDDIRAIHAESRKQGRRNSQHSPHPVRGFEDPSEARHLKNKKGEPSSRPSSHGFPTVKVPTDNVSAATRSSKHDTDPNDDLEDESVSNATVDPSVPDLDSYDAAKLQIATSEELRGLVAMMQVEFHGLQCAKVAAEMRAETLETDLSASAEERDAEVMRLSEEKDKWNRAAHRERASREGMEEKVASLEKEKEWMQKEWGKVLAAHGELEGRLAELEEENKKMRRKLKKKQKHDGRDSVDDASSVSTTEPPTNKMQSSLKTDHSPTLSSPRSPSSQQHCPQSVHSRLSSHDDRHPSSSNDKMPQAPASWHVPGRHMTNIRDLSAIPPVPLEVGRRADPTLPPFGMGPPRKSTSVHHAGSRRPASILRRKSSYGTASSTHSSVRSSLRGSSLSVPEEDVEDHRRLSEFMKSLESGMALVDHAEDGKERVDDSTRSGPL